jgi:hypothetical protein
MNRSPVGLSTGQRLTWALSGLVSIVLNAHGAIQLVPESETHHLFAGSNRIIEVKWKNDGTESATALIDAQIFAASSATVMPVSTIRWKRLEILPGQTVIEQVKINLPLVKGTTHFLIQWLENTNRVVGVTSVLVYPQDLLKELGKFAASHPVGVFDPGNELKPHLKENGVDFIDLSERELDTFRGELAIIGPFNATNDAQQVSAKAVIKAARRGAAVVWMQPSDSGEKLTPDFYVAAIGTGTVVVVQRKMLSDMAQSPLAQFRLIRLAETAIRRVAFNCLANTELPP